MECAINEDWPPGWSNLAMKPPTLNWPVFQFHCPTPVSSEGHEKPCLCLVAVQDILPRQEITYSYGDCDWPWRTKVLSNYG